MKVPRKVVLNESSAFFQIFLEFWEKHSHDFPHVDLADLLFVKSDEQSTVPFKRNLEIIVSPKELRLVLPQAKYMLVVYRSFNHISAVCREFLFYNCLYQIPKDYKENLRLRNPDMLGFVAVQEKFKSQLPIIHRGAF